MERCILPSPFRDGRRAYHSAPYNYDVMNESYGVIKCIMRKPPNEIKNDNFISSSAAVHVHDGQ